MSDDDTSTLRSARPSAGADWAAAGTAAIAVSAAASHAPTIACSACRRTLLRIASGVRREPRVGVRHLAVRLGESGVGPDHVRGARDLLTDRPLCGDAGA